MYIYVVLLSLVVMSIEMYAMQGSPRLQLFGQLLEEPQGELPLAPGSPHPMHPHHPHHNPHDKKGTGILGFDVKNLATLAPVSIAMYCFNEAPKLTMVALSLLLVWVIGNSDSIKKNLKAIHQKLKYFWYRLSKLYKENLHITTQENKRKGENTV
jgi:hypothetical protein